MMKKYLLLLVVALCLASCSKHIYKFTKSDRLVFEQFKIDIKSMQLYSPPGKIFLITIDTNIYKRNIDSRSCRIEKLSDIRYSSLYLRPYTKLTCIKAEDKDLYISFDNAYPPLVFREGIDGYYLLTDNYGFFNLGGKTYMLNGKFYLMIKGKLKNKLTEIIIPVKGNKPDCK